MFLIILSIIFSTCATNQQLKLRDNDISNIILTYKDQHILNDFIEKNNTRPYGKNWNIAYVDIDVSEEYWELIINELKKSTKFFIPFHTIFIQINPGPVIYSIKILYHNNNEVYINVFKGLFYVNSRKYYEPKNNMNNMFNIIEEIIKNSNNNNITINEID
jgi:hypothetical protein